MSSFFNMKSRKTSSSSFQTQQTENVNSSDSERNSQSNNNRTSIWSRLSDLYFNGMVPLEVTNDRSLSPYNNEDDMDSILKQIAEMEQKSGIKSEETKDDEYIPITNNRTTIHNKHSNGPMEINYSLS